MKRSGMMIIIAALFCAIFFISCDAEMEAIQPVTIEWDLNYDGAKVITTKQNLYDEIIEPNVNVVREGYEFDGWFTKSQQDSKSVKVLASNMKFFAKWTPCEYEITLHEGHYENISVKDAKVGSAKVTFGTSELRNFTQPIGVDGYHPENFYTSEGDDAIMIINGTELVAGIEGYTDAEGNWIRALDTVLFAKNNAWVGDQFKVNLVTNGGTIAAGKEVTSYTFETVKALPADTEISKTGYAFKGWFKSADFAGDAVTEIVSGTRNEQTYYAKWEANEYTVKFNAADEMATGEMADITVKYDEEKTLTANAFAKTGYTFQGWTDDTTTYTDSQKIKNLKSDNGASVELNATWKANEYTVKFNANTGDGTMAEQKMTYDVEANLTDYAFTKTGYTFQGWATTAAGSVEYQNKAAVKNLKENNGDSITLYAIWTANEGISYKVEHYTQNLDKNGYDLNSTDSSLAGVADSTIGASSKTIEGFTYEKQEGDKTIKADGTAVVKVYYTRNSYNLSWDLNGGKASNQYTQNGSILYGTKLVAPEVAKTGYTFKDWTVSVPENMPANDLSFTAAWNAIDYTATYELNGGSTKETMTTTFTVEDTIKLPVVVTRTGYVFNGWYSNAQFTGDVLTSVSNKAEDLSFYAKWTANEYTIKFDANGGKGTMADQAMVYDKSVTLNANVFTRTGYEFLGWSTKAVEPATATAASVTYADKAKVEDQENGATVTLYAVWKPYDYTIIYKASENAPEAEWEEVTVHYGEKVTFLGSNTFELDGESYENWVVENGTKRCWCDKSIDVDKLPFDQNTRSLSLIADWGFGVESQK